MAAGPCTSGGPGRRSRGKHYGRGGGMALMGMGRTGKKRLPRAKRMRLTGKKS